MYVPTIQSIFDSDCFKGQVICTHPLANVILLHYLLQQSFSLTLMCQMYAIMATTIIGMHCLTITTDDPNLLTNIEP